MKTKISDFEIRFSSQTLFFKLLREVTTKLLKKRFPVQCAKALTTTPTCTTSYCHKNLLYFCIPGKVYSSVLTITEIFCFELSTKTLWCEVVPYMLNSYLEVPAQWTKRLFYWMIVWKKQMPKTNLRHVTPRTVKRKQERRWAQFTSKPRLI